MTSQLDDLTTDAVGAWATAAGAWMEAVNEIWLGWLDLAAVESGETGFNQEVVVVKAQPAPTELRPGRFTGWDGKELPRDAVTVEPSRVAAGRETTVLVRVKSPGDLASGTYTGPLLNASDDACLVDEIGVLVVGGRVP
jgi:hypothetical protein